MGLRRRPCARGLNPALDFSCPSEDSSPRANRPDRSRTWDNVSGPHFLRPRSTGAGITVRGAPQGDDRATPGTAFSTGVSSRPKTARRTASCITPPFRRRASSRSPKASASSSKSCRARRAQRRRTSSSSNHKRYVVETALSSEGAVLVMLWFRDPVPVPSRTRPCECGPDLRRAGRRVLRTKGAPALRSADGGAGDDRRIPARVAEYPHGAAVGRVLVLHLTVLFGGWIVMLLGSPVGALVVLVALKTAADWRGHTAERRTFAARPVPAGGPDRVDKVSF